MLIIICKVAVTPISTQLDDLWNERYGVDINTQARKILCDSAETTIEARVCMVPSLHMLAQPMPKSRYSGEDMKKCIEVTGIASVFFKRCFPVIGVNRSLNVISQQVSHIGQGSYKICTRRWIS